MTNATELEEQKINATKRADLLCIDPRNIVVEDDFNVRTEYGDIEGLMHSLVSQGQIEPIKVTKIPKTETYKLTDGHRRMKAIMLAIEKGYEFPYVKATTGSANIEERVFEMVITGIGKKPLTMLEEAEAYKRIKDYGYDVKDIANRVGKSQVHVYNLLKLADVPQKVKNRIKNDDISGGTVLSILKDCKTSEDILQAVETAVANAENEAKEKGVTTKVKAKAAHAGKLSVLKTLEKALETAETLELQNTQLLKKLVNAVKKGVKPETIARYFE
jgi:ParB/RepB/Spo0J family partition protein